MRRGWSAGIFAGRSGGGAGPRPLAVVVAFLLLAFPIPLRAAAPTTALTGRVISGGVAAAGVTVTAASPALQGERSTVTNRNGRYWLTALPPGRYEVTFSRKGLQTLTKRTVVELARVARVDGALEPSEDEESITSTAVSVGVADTTALTTHYSDETLDRLPIRRNPVNAAFLAGRGGVPPLIRDGVVAFHGGGEEALEQVTILRGASTPDHEGPIATIARTRSGGEELFLSLRDTVTGGAEHVLEGAAGGRIVPEKLWFFASGFRSGFEGKLTAQLGAQHNLMALYDDAPVGSVTALRYAGTAGPNLTSEAYVSRATIESTPSDASHETLFARSTWVAGDHVLSAGGEATRANFFTDGSAFFINDRWLVQRWTINAGARYDQERLVPRVGVSYDLRGDGRQAVIANFSDYSIPLAPGLIRELTLGYATALGNTGSARIDLIRRDFGDFTIEGAEASLTYSLFGRFHTGGHYRWERTEGEVFFTLIEHLASGWAGIDLPVGEHEFGVTVLERYRSAIGSFEGGEAQLLTDLALRYSLPISRVRLTLAADVSNVFGSGSPFVPAREIRGWIRLRV